LTPEERTSLIERNGVMVKPAHMTKDEALDLALEALEKSTDNFPANVQHRKAIDAIKQARQQPVQEPVAKVAEVHMSRYTLEWTNGPLSEGTELFDRPAAQRQWVGLTEEEIKIQVWYNCTLEDMVRSVESKLKEKNT
jgi:hypothetical protein